MSTEPVATSGGSSTAPAPDAQPDRAPADPTRRGPDLPGDTRAGLLGTIRSRRVAVETYVHRTQPASTRLSTIAIISSALAAALTAGPAFGGEPFAETVRAGLSLDRPSSVWKLLCLGALVVSVTAAVSVQIEKSNDLRSRIGAAEAAGAMLDGLRTRLEFGRMSTEDAVQEYQDILAGIPFVHEPSADPAGRPPVGSGSTRRRALVRRWLSGVVAVLAALLLVATLVGYVRGVAGSSDGGPGTGASSTPPGTATPSPTPSPTLSPTSSPTPSPTPSPTVGEAVFAGRTEDGRTSVAVVVVAGRATAYLCDGRELEVWLEGSLSGSRLDLAGQDGATLTGTVDGDVVAGRVVAPSLTASFEGTAAPQPAGVYRARVTVEGVELLIRWVVFPDGDQVGISSSAGVPAGAPRLELPEGTFTAADGSTHRAERVRP